MSSTTFPSAAPSPRLARFNLPLAILWLASAVAIAGGYLLMSKGNSDQAAVYTSGQADYAALFSAQSNATVGGLLIGAGVVGALLGGAVLALRKPVVVPAPALAAFPAPAEEDLVDDDPFDDEADLDEAAAQKRAAEPVEATDAATASETGEPTDREPASTRAAE